MAAGCGRYAVLNSARTTTTENGLTGKSGYPSFDGVSTTLWAPSDHWGCFLLSFEGCTKCLKNDREQWRPLQNLHRSVTLEKRIFCCRIQNGVSATASRQLRLTPRLMASLKAEVKGSHPHTQLTSGMPSCPAGLVDRLHEFANLAHERPWSGVRAWVTAGAVPFGWCGASMCWAITHHHPFPTTSCGKSALR